MADNVENAITENAIGPKKASGDSGSVEQHSLTDLIEVDKYQLAKAASRRSGWPVRINKIKTGGTTE